MFTQDICIKDLILAMILGAGQKHEQQELCQRATRFQGALFPLTFSVSLGSPSQI